ncbi:MAG: hypothetical protein DRJ05_15695, partial [Bacteroidetes bacterium]
MKKISLVLSGRGLHKVFNSPVKKIHELIRLIVTNKKIQMEIISFGNYIEGSNYKVLDERRMRASAGIMFLLGLIAF